MQRAVATLCCAAAALGCVQLLGCAHARGSGPASKARIDVPPAADRPWEPPAELVRSAAPPVITPSVAAASSAEAAAAGAGAITLPQVFAALPDGKLPLPLAIDLALRNSPRTRATWLAARAAAAE